ncbi:MAG: M6 family metalloprotease domain-containing protein [Bacteroidales bacterium]|nr:M6 family metalloprotease domain-containing protein [Bacteroidales bacterium]
MKRLFILLITTICLMSAQAAYLKDIPTKVTQPDGTVLECFASGDEFFNYLHDANGYTIIQHPETGYYVYAEKRDGKLVATEIVAGRQDPASKGLQPYALISPEEWMARRKAWEVPAEAGGPKSSGKDANHGTLNNIAIFIRFSDDGQFTNSYSSIDNMFNDVSGNSSSLRAYFREASYNNIEIPTYFYPGHNGETIISYQDTYPKNYFEPYNASTNPNGYSGDSQRRDREFSLLQRAVNYVNANYPIPTSLDIDYDSDGYVDNVCFIVKGNVGNWNDLLWPHKWSLYDRSVYINGKRVWTFNFQLADATDYFNTSVMCHEMNHSLSAPDLYHYSYTGPSPVGCWDLMETTSTPPQHCGAYMKMKYGHWLDEIPEITSPGIYSLSPINSATPTNIAYKIASSDPNQYYVLEYRRTSTYYESALPGSGLLIYRIDTRFDGNANYDPDNGIYDEIYIFRPGGSTTSSGSILSAYFSADVGRTEFSASTSAYPFFTGGTIDEDFRIYDISVSGNTISFSYGEASTICLPPTNVVATENNGIVNLSWDAAINAQSYNIFRNGSFIGNISGTTYTDSDVLLGTNSYYLKSVDIYGMQSAESETASVTVIPAGYIYIGDESSNSNEYLPSYSYYSYSLTQQIYTASELGGAGPINSIAFYNEGETKTRTFDLYLKSTTKSSFSSNTDWVAVSASDKVFSGSVTMYANSWNNITFDTPFNYDGSSNLVLVTDDNTGQWSEAPHMKCRVYNATSKAIRVYSDGTNYNPISPSSYSGTILSVKNQVFLQKSGGTPNYTITVSADPSSGGTVSGGGSYTQGASCTITATANTDYAFTNWTKNGTVVSTNASYTFTVTSNATYVAHFTSTTPPGPTLLVEAEYYPDANDPESPYVKASWVEVNIGDATTFSYNFENSAIPDGWTTIDADGDGNNWELGSVGMSTGYGHNSSTDMIFSKSYDNDAGVLYPDNYLVSEPVTLVYGSTFSFWACAQDATYAAEHFGVFFSSASNTNPSDFQEIQSWTMTAKGAGAPTDVTRSGSRAQGTWYYYSIDLSSYAGTGYIAIRHYNCYDQFYLNVDDIALTVETKENRSTYNVYRANCGGGGQVTLATGLTANEYIDNAWTDIAPGSYRYGVSISSNAIYWSDCIVKPAPPVTTYQITATANPAAGGTVTGSNTYEEGATCILTATASTGYTFVNWTKNGTQVSTNPTYSFTVTQSASYVANFTLNTYEITVSANPAEGGTVTGANTYTHGTTATLTASPNTGYSFVKWTKNGTQVSTNPTYSFTVTQSASYVAHFTLNTYQVTVSADPAAGGTVTGGNTYTYGATATVEVTPNQYYVFDNWTMNGTVVSDEPSYTFVVTQDCQLVAHLTSCEGVEEDTASSLTLYPNPAQDKVYLRGSAMQTIKVYNTMGQLVIKQECGGAESIEINLSGLDSGIYTIAVLMNNGNVVNKLVVKDRQ